MEQGSRVDSSSVLPPQRLDPIPNTYQDEEQDDFQTVLSSDIDQFMTGERAAHPDEPVPDGGSKSPGEDGGATPETQPEPVNPPFDDFLGEEERGGGWC